MTWVASSSPAKEPLAPRMYRYLPSESALEKLNTLSSSQLEQIKIPVMLDYRSNDGETVTLDGSITLAWPFDGGEMEVSLPRQHGEVLSVPAK